MCIFCNLNFNMIKLLKSLVKLHVIILNDILLQYLSSNSKVSEKNEVISKYKHCLFLKTAWLREKQV